MSLFPKVYFLKAFKMFDIYQSFLFLIKLEMGVMEQYVKKIKNFLLKKFQKINLMKEN